MIDITGLSDDVVDLLRDAWWEGYDSKDTTQREDNPYAGVTEARQLERFAAMAEADRMLTEKYGKPSDEDMEAVRRLFEEEEVYEEAVAFA